MSPRAQELGQVEWALHPALDALLWLLRWAFAALCVAILWQFAETRAFLLPSDPEPTLWLGLWILIAIASTVPALTWADLYSGIANHGFTQYGRGVGTVVALVAAVLFLPVLGLYLWGGAWALDKAHQALVAPHGPSAIPVKAATPAPLLVAVLLSLIAALAGYVAFTVVKGTAARFGSAIAGQGLLRALRGALVMMIVRSRQPRRDFFMQTPVVGQLLPLVLVVAAYWYIPWTVFDALLAGLAGLVLVVMAIDLVAPPMWLHLGASAFESFDAFHRLRRAWGVDREGVTLIDRSGAEGVAHYQAIRESARASGSPIQAALLNNPTVPRVWSLRTRPSLWRHTVRLLMGQVCLVVCDMRRSTDFLDEELEWLAVRGLMAKAWLLVDDGAEARARGLNAATLDELLEARWTRDGLRLGQAAR